MITAPERSRSDFLAACRNVLDWVEKGAGLRFVADVDRAIEWAVTEAAPQDTILIITGERGLTAHEQRTNLAKIEQCIEQARGQAEQIETDTKPKLSVFGI